MLFFFFGPQAVLLVLYVAYTPSPSTRPTFVLFFFFFFHLSDLRAFSVLLQTVETLTLDFPGDLIIEAGKGGTPSLLLSSTSTMGAFAVPQDRLKNREINEILLSY